MYKTKKAPKRGDSFRWFLTIFCESLYQIHFGAQIKELCYQTRLGDYKSYPLLTSSVKMCFRISENIPFNWVVEICGTNLSILLEMTEFSLENSCILKIF